jgi:hypothetical protein
MRWHEINQSAGRGIPMRDNEIRNLFMKQAITEQIYNYCRSMDRCDHELGYSVWHPDGTADYGLVYQGSGRGFVDAALRQHECLQTHCHSVSNILIKIGGDKAASESYCLCTHRHKKRDGIFDAILNARYIDTWSYREDHWRIDHRVCSIDFYRTITADVSLPEFSRDALGVDNKTQDALSACGRRDKTDVSYETFARITA